MNGSMFVLYALINSMNDETLVSSTPTKLQRFLTQKIYIYLHIFYYKYVALQHMPGTASEKILCRECGFKHTIHMQNPHPVPEQLSVGQTNICSIRKYTTCNEAVNCSAIATKG